MLLFDDYIEVGLVEYTTKFLDVMKNWQKYDYFYRENKAKENLQEWYEAIDEKGKVINGKKKYMYTKEEKYEHYLKELEEAKKWDEERKIVERMIQNRLRNLKMVTAIVIKPSYSDNSIDCMKLGLKVGHVGYPHINMERDVLIFLEYQEGEFYDEKHEESTLLVWSGDLATPFTALRTINYRPLKLMEWYQKLANESFW